MTLAICGQRKPLAASSSHHSNAAPWSQNTDPTQRNPKPRPSVRRRWIRHTKRTSRSRSVVPPGAKDASASRGEVVERAVKLGQSLIKSVARRASKDDSGLALRRAIYRQIAGHEESIGYAYTPFPAICDDKRQYGKQFEPPRPPLRSSGNYRASTASISGSQPFAPRGGWAIGHAWRSRSVEKIHG